MKKFLAVAAILMLGLVVGRIFAQTSQPATFQATGASTSCSVPPVGSSSLCIAGDKVLVSTNGGAWVQIGVVAPAAGVASISVNGGAAQTGAVALTIPSKATTTVGTPPFVLNSSGALTVGPPTAITTIQ